MDQTSTYSPLVMQETSDGLRLYDLPFRGIPCELGS